jgi:hypothetical protein
MFCDTMVDDDRSALGKSVDFDASFDNISSLSCSQHGTGNRRQLEAMLETLQGCVVGYCPTGDGRWSGKDGEYSARHMMERKGVPLRNS